MPASPEESPIPAGVAILGPTGSGKSALAMQLATHRSVEIVSVDSAQVYRGLDIGTAKPSAAERRAVPHHLLDIRDPEQVYSAGEFRTDALRCVREISARGNLPLLVGGTMLYFRALFRGIADLPTADMSLRRQLDARASVEGWPALHAQLQALDPQSAAAIHPHDAQRIQRAMELSILSGRTREQLWDEPSGDTFAGWRIVVLEPADRQRLHAALEQRLDTMLASGFVDEARRLRLRTALSDKSHTLRLVGYRQLLDHVSGSEPLEVARQKILAATRQLAKRQLTWLRGNSLLPSGATVLRGDPFDVASMRFLIEALRKGTKTP